ncbi:hypothetical protein [Deinococcus saxicola]|uniref:hypothetical protein n=1 Tax=Deinococcus saxicola TaxID=249406 RepID=UPI0039F1327D
MAVRYFGGGPVDLVTRIESTLRDLGRQTHLTFAITDYVPNVRVCHRSVSGLAHFHVRRGAEAAPR